MEARLYHCDWNKKKKESRVEIRHNHVHETVSGATAGLCVIKQWQHDYEVKEAVAETTEV